MIRACGDYQPEPYRQAGARDCHYLFTYYIDLLGAEVHGARVTAGRIAAALGGLFVSALQVYGKFAP